MKSSLISKYKPTIILTLALTVFLASCKLPTTTTPGIKSWMVSTLAGRTWGYHDAIGTAAEFHSPKGVAVDSDGNVYVADHHNNRIRKITPEGVVSTLAGTGIPGFANGTDTEARFSLPSGVAVDSSGNVYVADTSNHRIRKIITSKEGVVTVSTLAGNAEKTPGKRNTSGFVNGAGTEARFDGPSGVAVDSSGNIYVVDYNNHLIRKIEYK